MDLSDFKLMEKGELHVHLNGLVSTETIKSLLADDLASMPPGFDLDKDLNVLCPAESLSSYLKPWQVLRLIPKSRSCLKVLVENAFINLKSQGVCFVEIRNSILYLALLNNITVEDAMIWVITEVAEASGRHGIEAGLILTTSRGDYASDHLRALLSAYKNLGCPDTVVGLDLAGNEDVCLPDDISSIFVNAKDRYGLGITIHAGETGKVENVIEAVLNFGADRIGHGTSASKSIEVMELLRERDVCVEVCPVSNRLTNAVPVGESHPVIDFIKNDVPFVICSDNPGIHRSSISEDYLEFFRETSDISHIKKMYSNQRKYSFIKGEK